MKSKRRHGKNISRLKSAALVAVMLLSSSCAHLCEPVKIARPTVDGPADLLTPRSEREKPQREDLQRECAEGWTDPLVIEMCVEFGDLLDREIRLIELNEKYDAIDIFESINP